MIVVKTNHTLVAQLGVAVDVLLVFAQLVLVIVVVHAVVVTPMIAVQVLLQQIMVLVVKVEQAVLELV